MATLFTAKRSLLSASISLALCHSAMVMAAESEQVQNQSQVKDASLEHVEVTGSEDDGYLSQDTSTASRFGLKPIDVPQSLSSIGEEQLRDFALFDSVNALRSVPGVVVQQVESDRTYYEVRGFEVRNFQYDGVGAPTLNGVSLGDQDLAPFERIDVLKGANGVFTGGGMPGATINFVRKRPTDDLQGQFSVTYGSWDKSRIEADVSGAVADSVRLRGVVAHQDQDSYVDRYELKRTAAYVVGEFDITETTLLTVGYDYLKRESDDNTWGGLPLIYRDGSPTDYDISKNPGTDWAYWELEQHRSFVEVAQQIGDDWEIKAVWNRIGAEGDSNLWYLTGVQDKTNGLGVAGRASKYTLNQDANALDLFAVGDIGPHKLVAGFNWTRAHQKDASWADPAFAAFGPAIPVTNFNTWDGQILNPLDPTGNSVLVPNFTELVSDGLSTDTQLSLYAQSDIQIIENLNLTLGARVTNWETEGTAHGGADITSEFNGEFVPYYGLVYKPMEGLSLYGSYTETFNVLRELGANGKRLDPARGSNAEIGMKAEVMDSKGLVTLALFETKLDGLPVQAGVDANNQPFYRGAVVKNTGVETTVSGEVVDNLYLNAGYTFLEIEGDREVERYTPKHQIVATGTYAVHGFEALKFGTTIRWQSEVEREIDTFYVDLLSNPGVPGLEPVQGVRKQDAYAVVDLMASYQFIDALILSVNVNNVFDEKYLESVRWQEGVYAAPANYSATLTYAF